MELNEEVVNRVLNEVADEIIDAADVPDTGVRDALNLMVNAVNHRLFADENATLEEIVEAEYEASYEEVLGWINE